MNEQDIQKLNKVLKEEFQAYAGYQCGETIRERVMKKMSPPKERKYRVTFKFVSRNSYAEIATHGSCDFSEGLKKFIATYYADDVGHRIWRELKEITED